jgi:hypothetical protein
MDIFHGQARSPLAVGDGVGIDSTAMLMGFEARGIRPDLIMFADTGGEKDETYGYKDVQNAWLKKVGFPLITTVVYKPEDFKNFPPYATLEENCLTNGTLPSLAFGFGSCSQKWKAAAQHKFVLSWAKAVDCWTAGGRVRKAIGYDASKRDKQRRTNAGRVEDPQYEYVYPLQDWDWDRDRCIKEIVSRGLPGYDPCYLNGAGPVKWVKKGGIPLKSSCFFCPAMKKWEVSQLPKDKLQRIVIMEARAKPRLEGWMTQPQLDARYKQQLAAWEARGKTGKEPRHKLVGDPNLVKGLWRDKVMTDYIRAEGLLTEKEIQRLTKAVPKELAQRNEDFAAGEEVESWPQFFENVCGG